MCYALLTTLGCFFLGFSTSQVYQQSMDVYYFVSEFKTFAEAQLYCRATYTDLVTIENTDDLHTLQTDQVTYRSAWIGLMETALFHWHWALADRRFYKDGEIKYRNWAQFEPDDRLNQDCVIMTYKGLFQNTNCRDLFNFICYDGEKQCVIWRNTYNIPIYSDSITVHDLITTLRLRAFFTLLSSTAKIIFIFQKYSLTTGYCLTIFLFKIEIKKIKVLDENK